MGKMKDLIIVKLGGSLMTHKDSPLKANSHAIGKVAVEIAGALRKKPLEGLVLIHGGGSFGHYYASRYHISLTPKKIPSGQVSRTASAMISLHTMILDRLVAEGVPCKTLLASELLSDKNEISVEGMRHVLRLLENDLVPITFGNILVTRWGSKIVSGDAIALALASVFRVRSVIFAMDVDGIYQTSNLKGGILRELNSKSMIRGSLRRYDVTGGVISKTKVGVQIANLGTDVYYVNGRKSGRLRSLILGRGPVKSTHIAAMRISM